MRGLGTASGTCGELVQGVTSGGSAFQVTLPIDLGAEVSVEVQPSNAVSVDAPPWMQKARAAATETLALLGVGDHEVVLRHKSALPVGKGMGSSTADVVATARAVADAFGRVLTPEELASIAGGIEPSDGTMHERIVAVRRDGRLLRSWSWTPTFVAVVLIPEHAHDTAPNLPDVPGTHAEYDALLLALDDAVTHRDAAGFARAGATSAALHRDWIGSEWDLDDDARSLGAVGWNIAHTGSVAGVLFTDVDAARRAAPILAERHAVETLVVHAG